LQEGLEKAIERKGEIFLDSLKSKQGSGTWGDRSEARKDKNLIELVNFGCD